MSAANILFVDDELNLLNALKRMLNKYKAEFSVDYALSGAEALTLMERKNYDIVISDMRMGGMDGADFLEIVMQKYPETTRIILSGQSGEEMVFKSIRPTHQFLSKPCSPERILQTIRRNMDITRYISQKSIQRIIAHINTLPVLPEIYTELERKMDNPETSIKEIGLLIEKDIGLSSQVLKLVNSSYFGFYDNITAPAKAVGLLGIELIKSLILSQNLFHKENMSPDFGRLMKTIWDISYKTGVNCHKISHKIFSGSKITEASFTVGLLHKIGLLVLASELPLDLNNIFHYALINKKSLIEVEQMILETNHAEIGAYLLGLWGFSPEIFSAIAGYPRVDSKNEDLTLSDILHLTAFLVQQEEFPRYDYISFDEDLLDQKLIRAGFPLWKIELRELITG